MGTSFITPAQCRMARAYLGWSQQQLAGAAGLALNTISNLEKDGHSADPQTIQAIASALQEAGLAFVDGGVVPRQVRSYLLGSYLDLLNDIAAALPDGGEVLKHCVDDRRSTPEVARKVAAMRAMGIRERLTVAEDNDVIAGPAECYRRIPARYFASSEVVIIYLNRVAFFVEGQALVIVSDSLAKVFRDQFEYWWQEGEAVDGA